MIKTQSEFHTDHLFSDSHTNSYHLSIEIDQQYISCLVLDPKEQRFIAFERHVLSSESTVSADTLLNHCIQESKLLQFNYEKVIASYSDQAFTFVPTSLYSNDARTDIIALNFEIKEDDLVVNEKIDGLDSYNIYLLSEALKNCLVKQHPSAHILHHKTILLQSFMGAEMNSEKNTFGAVHFRENEFDLILTKKGKLVLCNSYNYKADEDMLYYILFAAEQEKIELKDAEFLIAGNIGKYSTTMQLLHKYVPNLSFAKKHDKFNYGSFFVHYSDHLHYTLTRQFLCV